MTGLVNAEHIAETAEETQADLIVMGSHGRKGFQKMILGSFAQDVLGASQIPVLIVKNNLICASSRCAIFQAVFLSEPFYSKPPFSK